MGGLDYQPGGQGATIDAKETVSSVCTSPNIRLPFAVIDLLYSRPGISYVSSQLQSSPYDGYDKLGGGTTFDAKEMDEVSEMGRDARWTVFETGRSGPALTSAGLAVGLWTKPGRP